MDIFKIIFICVGVICFFLLLLFIRKIKKKREDTKNRDDIYPIF